MGNKDDFLFNVIKMKNNLSQLVQEKIKLIYFGMMKKNFLINVFKNLQNL